MTSGPRRALALAGVLALIGALAPEQARAQETEQWNASDALALVARARDARQADAVDPERRAYQALATGHVFFLIDRPSSGERTLIKADQIAIEVYWKAPRATRQRIVGMRDQKTLPTNIRYHLDHLTVVQDDFADLIKIGDGDEVSSVVHPVAPGAEQIYDYALGDALQIGFPDGGHVDVQEIRVRPRALDRPGFVGSVYVDQGSAAIVRLKFTFTPASYVDSSLDYIQIALDNSLWEGRWWLPYKQELEVRRELPQLDFLVGGVIRGRFDVGEYVLNPDLPDALFAGNRVTIVPEAQRKAYPFEEPLIPPVETEGLVPTPTLEEVRAEALKLTAGKYLSGLSRFRLYVPSASHVFRWNRAEGVFLGLGFAWHAVGSTVLKAHGGWSFGRDDPAGALLLESATGRASARATWHELRDLGPFAGELGSVNSLAAVATSDDWLDPWFSSGVQLTLRTGAARPMTRLGLTVEHHDSARIVVADAEDFRPVPVVDEGWLLALELERAQRLAPTVELDLTARVGRFERAARPGAAVHGALLASLSWDRTRPGGAPGTLAQLDAGVEPGDLPPQLVFRLGGRGTLPGHPFRVQTGDAFWLARAEASRGVLWPWVTARVFGAAGAAGDGWASAEDAFPSASLTPPGFERDTRVRASAGAGVGLLWDVVHVDWARGLAGGEWELVVSADRRFRGWL